MVHSGTRKSRGARSRLEPRTREHLRLLHTPRRRKFLAGIYRSSNQASRNNELIAQLFVIVTQPRTQSFESGFRQLRVSVCPGIAPTVARERGLYHTGAYAGDCANRTRPACMPLSFRSRPLAPQPLPNAYLTQRPGLPRHKFARTLCLLVSLSGAET
jgi:hypothetical protein